MRYVVEDGWGRVGVPVGIKEITQAWLDRVARGRRLVSVVVIGGLVYGIFEEDE